MDGDKKRKDLGERVKRQENERRGAWAEKKSRQWWNADEPIKKM